MTEFLLEIGIEEVPARMMAKAAADLHEAFAQLFASQNLACEGLESSAAPRQLTLWATHLEPAQPDREEVVVGPPHRIAYDSQGAPSKALLAFLAKYPGLSVEELFTQAEKKGDVVAARIFSKGRPTHEILTESIPALLEKLHFPKTMRWGNCPTRFVRPVRSLLALFDGQVLPFQFAGIAAGNHSFGHRFAGMPSFPVDSIADYRAKKAGQGILLTHAERRAKISEQLAQRIVALGAQLVADEALLEEISDLVESPYVVQGAFPEKFLAIPREVLITSIREHQKSFTVEDESGRLMPYFLSIANVSEDRKGLIKKGNEWVLNARLWDAQFFWESDLEKDLDQLRLKLEHLTFQQKLGSYLAKAERLEALVGSLTAALGWNPADCALAATAARHAKTDLVSELVFEFTELQGNVGGLLLQAKGFPESVWRAVYEHYKPLNQDDTPPESKFGALLGIADKLDTLVGCFACGLIPTGSKDPYALRRAAQGIVVTLIESGLPLELDQMLEASAATYGQQAVIDASLLEQLREFFVERVRHQLKRADYDHDLVEAIIARDMNRIDQVRERAEAIRRLQGRDWFRTLAHNLKRMNNVIADELDQLPEFNPSALTEVAELELWARFKALEPAIKQSLHRRHYDTAMDLMTNLAAPIEAYFGTSGVFINVTDTPVRLNRKAMINRIRLTLGMVADISCLAPKT